MSMSYSQSGIDLLFFSTDQEALLDLISDIREKVDKKGGEYKGPMPLPQVDPDLLHAFLLHISDPESEETMERKHFPDWLFDAMDSEEHVEALVSASENESALFARRLEIMGDRVVSSILSLDVPDEVLTVATSIKKTHQKGRNSPYTWDPSIDHIPSHPDGPW